MIGIIWRMLDRSRTRAHRRNGDPCFQGSIPAHQIRIEQVCRHVSAIQNETSQVGFVFVISSSSLLIQFKAILKLSTQVGRPRFAE